MASRALSLTDFPRRSAVVQNNEFRKLLSLDNLVYDLTTLGDCMRIAYHATSGEGLADIQNEVQKHGFEVARLCRKSATTLYAFKEASSRVLDNLETTYEYLCDGFEDMAIIGIEEITKTADEMKNEAESLRASFENQEKGLEELSSKANLRRDSIKALQKKKEGMEEQKLEKEKAIKNLEASIQESERLFEECKANELDAQRNLTSGYKAFANMFTNQLFRAPVYNMSAYEEAKKEARQEKAKYEEQIQKLEQQRLEAADAMEKLVIKLQKIGKSNLATAAADALQQAKEVLKQIAIIMGQISLFWDVIKQRCEKVKSEGAMKQKKIETSTKELYNIPTFIREAHQFYGEWVSLQSIFAECTDKMFSVQRDLYDSIREVYLPHEAHQKVMELVPGVLQRINEQKKAIKAAR